MKKRYKLAIGLAVVLVVISTVVVYAPTVVESITTPSPLSVEEVVNHAARYIGKEITIEGRWATMGGGVITTPEVTCTIYAENAPYELINMAFYRFTGVLYTEQIEGFGEVLKLRISRVESA